jgi:hypothetical protein
MSIGTGLDAVEKRKLLNLPALKLLPLIHPKVEVKVTLRLTVIQSVCLGIEHPCGTCDQILLPV